MKIKNGILKGVREYNYLRQMIKLKKDTENEKEKKN